MNDQNTTIHQMGRFVVAVKVSEVESLASVSVGPVEYALTIKHGETKPNIARNHFSTTLSSPMIPPDIVQALVQAIYHRRSLVAQ